MSADEETRKAPWRVAPVIALLTFVTFLPVLSAEFVAWDDNRNFLGNPNYRGLGLGQLKWMWTTTHMGHYVPLTWMTLGLDYELWGMNPAGYHLVNLLLHCANAVLLYLVTFRLLRLSTAKGQPAVGALGVPAGLAALLFAVHPLRVESVAWVTERRDMLSLLFYLTALLCYLRKNDGRDNDNRWYWFALLAFVCALLSKATAVTLPAILFILNVYPLRRIGTGPDRWNATARRAYVEIAPFAFLAAAASIVSVLVLHPPNQLKLGAKVAVSAYSLGFYLWKTVVPSNLAPLYEMPRTIDPMAAKFLWSYLLVAALVAVLWLARRRSPGVTAAALAFLVTIVPLLGIVQNGPQIAADRYTYHAAPALAILGGAALVRWHRPWLVVASAALLVLWGSLTWKQSGVWHDSESLWSRVLRVDNTSSIGQVAMGDLRIKQNRDEDALGHYQRAVALDPDYAEGHNNLGVLLSKRGRLAEAIVHYRRASTLRHDYADPHLNWGVALASQGGMVEAIEQYRLALTRRPDYTEAQVNWGNALTRLGKPAQASSHYAEALRLRPGDADAHLNWGVALAQQQKYAEAIVHFNEALSVKPDLPEAREYLARARHLLQQAGMSGHRQ